MTFSLLKDKRIIVTGGSRGLGFALCAAFLKAGAKVAFTYSRDEAKAKESLASLAALSDFHPLALKIHCADYQATTEAFRQIESEWGGIDILVNNAGVSQVLPLGLLEEEDWDKMMDVNVKGVFLTSKAALKGMIRRKSGVILNIGSVAGVRLIAAPIHYATSKAALKGLTESLAKEVAPHGIRINCLALGLLTEGLGNLITPAKLQDYLKHSAIGRLITPKEAAHFATFLVSDKNSFMSGATVVMDGGL